MQDVPTKGEGKSCETPNYGIVRGWSVSKLAESSLVIRRGGKGESCSHVASCVRAKRERTLILAGLPMANVRSRVAFRIWVSGLLLASPQIFSGAWQSRTAFWVRLALWVRPGANRLLGTLFWRGMVVLSLGYFSNYLKANSCTRYW